MADFTFLVSKTTANSESSHKIKRCQLLGRKAMTNLDNILKSRDITLPTKISTVKAMCFFICLFVCFPVVIYGCKGWTIKKAEHQRTDTFKLWYWKRLSRVPQTSRRSNQSILKEMNSGYPIGRTYVEAEVPVLWPPVMKSLLIGKDSDAGKD